MELFLHVVLPHKVIALNCLFFSPLKALLQSSASRKTQKKKKKKVGYDAVCFMEQTRIQDPNVSTNFSLFSFLKASKTVETATGQAMETEAAE